MRDLKTWGLSIQQFEGEKPSVELANDCAKLGTFLRYLISCIAVSGNVSTSTEIVHICMFRFLTLMIFVFHDFRPFHDEQVEL